MSEPNPLSDVERERMVLRHLAERNARYARPLGVVGFVAGAILVGMIGMIGYFIGPAMMANGESVDGMRFTGGPGAGMLIFALFAVVASIGFVAMIGGALQAVTGRRSTRIARFMMVVTSLLFGLAAAARLLP